ncbi:hypothetical protein PF005_g5650 [Phytophthora fragariae]|uniref:Ankyrin repeat domain-containing protein n=1 Tax=Phytophthora fragariae TaxID=53985 RepID=A0A6A3FRA0_9STRA|nr:hypothetical protein PF003_g33452 [Phytophthora fragariae]KAE8944208.1 hypothetical protein PF009_g6105 [Phytophthora fragariae]KAE9022129.1 hypothetical protein PF011_g4630 [Phytophthora fragariae]KAE9127004.1 hypothetical protein PF007_g5778 [Phytophthora fragariae]KAE9127015.1 hypothetical protein PF010_g5081 [Phytophthora fragariae]
MTGEFAVLTAVQVVYRECFHDDQGEFPHVARRIDAFVGDLSSHWTLVGAYERTGNLRFLKLLAARVPMENDPEPLYRLWEFSNVAKVAAARGDLDTMVWLAEIYQPEASLSLGAAAAAGSGHLHVLKWLHQEQRSRVHWGGLEWCEAVKCGRTEVVQWLTENVPVHPEAAPRVLFEAARVGDLDVVRWLLDDYNLSVAKAFKAAQEGHQWQIVRWLFTNCEVGDRTVDGAAAAKDGELAFLQWACEHASVDLGGSILLNAVAFNGHLGALQWLHDGPAKIELGASVFAQAARGGHLEMLKWLHSRQCPARAVEI